VTGPFETENQARAEPAVQAVYAAFDLDPGAGKMAPHNYRMLAQAAEAAGVELGAYDDRILHWLAGWEPTTCAVLAGIISRARVAGCDPELSMPATFVRSDGSASLTRQDRLTCLGGLADAAGLLEHRAVQFCPDCEASPAEVCDEHAADLDAAAEYRAVAARLGEDR
jgi:hypothetical protein